MTHEQLQALLSQAEEEQNKGNYDQAERLANEVLSKVPDDNGNGAERQGNELRAHATRILGVVSWRRSDYPKALEHLNSSLLLSEEIADKAGIAKALGSIGSVHQNLSDYPKALEYYGKALSIAEELGNKAGVATKLGNIGSVHQNLSDYPKALEYYGKALSMFEELGNKAGVSIWLGNIGIVHQNLSDYPKALEYYGKALTIAEELGNKAEVAAWLGNIGSVHQNLSDYPKALEYYGKALTIAEELGNKAGVANHLGNIGAAYSTVEFEGFDAVKAEEFLLKALAISTEIGAKSYLVGFHKTLSELYEHEKRWEEAFAQNKKHIAIKDEINIEEVKKQESIREQQKAIEIERTRATAEKNILNNILPEEITTRLIKGENPIADHFDSVSILFMDIVDFTRISTTITAQQLVHLLNAIFTAADGVMREFGLEKIKTIGDAYMAVAGAPVIQEDHTHRAAHAALKLLDVMQNLVVTFPEEYGDRTWIESIPEIQVRIGVHCGPAAAGVVGENKFLYDLWGDAVNTASRMESHGEAGRIHVSEEFVIHLTQTLSKGDALLTDTPSLLGKVGMGLIERDEIEMKGKGMMRTYFLERSDGNG
ncbi:MAG: adenylate/guanylate cyclase domain-containing protein [Candidatus Kapaibacterium sp.]|nr:tetratricopeptide repeat protein [Bacteroidota bacterium]